MERNENESLVALEYLLDEFFNPVTSNSRKHEIEQQLSSFKYLPQSRKLCLYFLTNTSSQYVTMFALSTLESVINQQWANTDWPFREELKNTLYNYLIEKGNSAPHFIRSKYAKLLVIIAKQDWPSQYPNFFINIIELLKSEPNQLIGLILLKTTSEELMGLQASFENGRKDEITRLLHQYIPVVFDSLNTILENLGTKPRHTATATPPPSPTHPTSAPSLPQQLATATFKPDSKALNKEALETVQHLFTWVQINQIPPSIIKAIFHFTNISSYAQDDHDMCVLAMSTINELLYRKCTPPGSQEFFTQLYYYTIELLRDITNSRLDTLDPIFVEKMSELLTLLVEQHLWRLEAEPRFSALDFLSLLYQLTVQLPSMQCYLRCLNVWAAFFKQTKSQKNHKYLEAFLALLTALLQKIQFSTNASQLKEIDNVDTNDDNETDWQIFLKTSIEIVSMVAEYAPLETLNLILMPWKTCYDIYRRIETIVDHQNCSLNCELSESERLSYIITDFSSLTQTLARLSPLFFDQENEEITNVSSPMINNLIEKLLESASLATSVRLYNLKTNNSHLTDCFIDNHSQLLAALKTYLIWITRNDKVAIENLKLIVDITLPVIHTSVPLKISNSSAHLFLALSNLPCSPNLILLPDVSHFINAAPNFKFRDIETNFVTCSAITNLLLKPWPDCSQENANHRSALTGVFFDGLTWPFRDLTLSNDEQRVRQVTEDVLPIVSHIVDFCKDFPIASKRRLFLAIKTTIEQSIVLFPAFAKNSEISNCILVVFLNVLRVLQQQLGVEGTKNAVQVFLEVAVKEQGAGNFLDKLLQIFQLVVEAPGSGYKNFLPGILQLCMDNVYPFILSHGAEKTDAFMSLLTLLHSILLHRWQYFYSSQVRLGYSPVYTETENDAPEPVQLMAVLQVFGQALLQQDINIFKLSLASLEDLNAKWKLYLNVLFRYNGLSKYLSVLLQTLIDKSQSLLSEDIQVAIYNMAAVNFDHFFSTFLPDFIRNIDAITDQQREILLTNFMQNHDKDMPTFVQHLRIFVNDAQHFKLCSLS
ncbi:exportin-6 [Tribolium castaneum]|nr:PREDICTED: exportin-6 [Tribolium castaneum]|eukprot:XP_008196875.1 PREDICTED: exportin-6 [Tribolium castaneum]